MNKLILSLFALITLITSSLTHAGENVDLVGAQGYDLVSYHQGNGEPLKGNGNNVAYHDGVTYLFANAANKKTFQKNPTKYLPAYGGYCAFGVTKEKKFNGDPLVYKVVDGKLYLNLNGDIQKLWEEDVKGNISAADDIWPDIKDTHASKL